jgi:hypothetical protein
MRLLAAAILLLFASPALTTPEPIAIAEVVRDGDSWTVDYQLDVHAPVWVFARSDLPRVKKQSWRIDTMEVLMPGVSLRRIGHYDALVADKGNVPAKVRLRFKPFIEDIESSYDAALAFSDGSVALYSQQFKILPMRSLAMVKAAPIDSDEIPAAAQPTRVTFRDKGGPVLAKGARQDSFTISDDDAYILFGKADPVIGKSLTTIIDPALPKWLGDYITADLPRMIDGYAEKLGPPPTGQPMLMASWNGPTDGVTSMGGSVLPGTVVMTFEGEGVLQPNPAVRDSVRWFVAHESAHFWLGQAVIYESPQESWITEGGADLLAIRAVAAADPSYDAAKRLREARDECLPFLAKGGVASANQRGDHRAYYACGAIVALAAEQASGGDFASFVKALIDKYGGDGIVTRAEWLALLDERAPGMSAEVAKLLDQSHADAPAALNAFASRTGIGHTMQVKEVTR